MTAAGKGSPWYVYIVCCNDGTLYTGITTDLKRGLSAHNSPKGGAKYTKARRPVALIYAEETGSRSEAAKREYRIKQMSLMEKWRIVEDNKGCVVS